jgi:hypothetical protein
MKTLFGSVLIPFATAACLFGAVPTLQSVDPLAVEFRFNAANGVSYRIEGSTDLIGWTTVEPTIIGTGGVVTRFYSTENIPTRYFRARRN